MLKYYITYVWLNKDGHQVESWMIIEINHDLDTADGLQKFIKELEYSKGPDTLLRNWKQLDKGTRHD